MSQTVGHRTVSHASITRFGELTGDYAQMHFDRDFGPDQGMGGTIAHGLLSGSWALGALALHAPERLGLGDAERYLMSYCVQFDRMIFVDDLFSLRWEDVPAGAGGSGGDDEDGRTIATRFEIVNQRGEVTTSGLVGVARRRDDGKGPIGGAPPLPLDIAAWRADQVSTPVHADEMVESGPRGESHGRTVTETDLVDWTNFTGDLNPAHLDAHAALATPERARTAPPMWIFCRSFGDYLRELLRISMPSSGFAGHLGDSWRVIRPVTIGDTLRTRHRPVSFKPSGSRPGMGVVEFALHTVNQRDEIVLDGRVAMMMRMR